MDGELVVSSNIDRNCVSDIVWIHIKSSPNSPWPRLNSGALQGSGKRAIASVLHNRKQNKAKLLNQRVYAVVFACFRLLSYRLDSLERGKQTCRNHIDPGQVIPWPEKTNTTLDEEEAWQHEQYFLLLRGPLRSLAYVSVLAIEHISLMIRD